MAVTLIVLGASKSVVNPVSVCGEGKDTVIINLTDDRFEPETIKVSRCSKVIFENVGEKPHWPASNIHPSHGIYPEFDPKEPIEKGKSWSFVFDKEGIWKYHDHLFPAIRGVIEVYE